MKIFIYIKKHHNYPFVIGEKYEGCIYKNGWIQMKSDGQLYRKEYFKEE